MAFSVLDKPELVISQDGDSENLSRGKIQNKNKSFRPSVEEFFATITSNSEQSPSEPDSHTKRFI